MNSDMYAVVGVSLYGRIAPRRFGNLFVGLFSMFQLLTLDNWFDVVDEIRPFDQGIIGFLLSFIVVDLCCSCNKNRSINYNRAAITTKSLFSS